MATESTRHIVREVYSEVLFELAEQMGCVDAITEDLSRVQEVFKARLEFTAILTSPGIKGGEKVQIFRRVFDGKVDSACSGASITVGNSIGEAVFTEKVRIRNIRKCTIIIVYYLAISWLGMAIYGKCISISIADMFKHAGQHSFSWRNNNNNYRRICCHRDVVRCCICRLIYCLIFL